MTAYFWVGLGGALGSVGRHWISSALARHWGESFPWGTLTVNVTGSFALGLLAALLQPDARHTSRHFFMVGLCGGYTTFSAFSLQTFDLMRTGEWWRAGSNAMLSVILCVLAVWAGYSLGTVLNSTRGS
ncbi:MAG TPA: fluoride efflux transporter CrcB [Verrucomicrobia bacterium]|nr:fluoride efflux transporter CrcB [Verrucomicrobiota bacterium]HOP98429.1 fluoride efflux transporter CrcB [Verrucomicrobiota bacterium]HPU55713.1 fluoride efflux transporter CrcB [Verrucomicrobiota bacterium]